MRVIEVQSVEDPRLEDYREVKERDRIVRRGVFLAEGELVVRRLLEAHASGGAFRARSALLSGARFVALRGALEGAGDLDVFVTTQERMDGVVGFHIHRGALAAGERAGDEPALGEAVAALARRAEREGGGLALVMETIANHDNIGGLFRSAAAFGAGLVVLAARCADPLYRKALRVSMGCVLHTPFVRAGSAREAAEALRAEGFTTLAMTPAEDAEEIRTFMDRERPRRVALLVGAEGPGLSDEALRAADARVRIAMAPGVDSLNVAMAAAVGMYVVGRGRGASARPG